VVVWCQITVIVTVPSGLPFVGLLRSLVQHLTFTGFMLV
jgi:hypothetical protein